MEKAWRRHGEGRRRPFSKKTLNFFQILIKKTLFFNQPGAGASPCTPGEEGGRIVASSTLPEAFGPRVCALDGFWLPLAHSVAPLAPFLPCHYSGNAPPFWFSLPKNDNLMCVCEIWTHQDTPLKDLDRWIAAWVDLGLSPRDLTRPRTSSAGDGTLCVSVCER